jgi:hypothetical protein
VPGGSDRDVDGCERGQAVARVLVREHDRLRRDLGTDRLDEARRERPSRGRLLRGPAAEPDDDDGQEEERGSQSRGGLERRRAPDEADHEGDDGADNGVPGDPWRAGIVEDVPEIAREGDLERDARRERCEREGRPDDARQHAEPAGEREREGEEAGGPPGL